MGTLVKVNPLGMDLQDAIEFYRTAQWESSYYQDIPSLGLDNCRRKNDRRVKDLKLEIVDFSGKVVWDIGCAGGFFLRYALDHGAKKAIGFEKLKVAMCVSAINHHLGYDIDFYGVDLNDEKKFSGIEPCNIAIFASMNYHVKRCPRKALQYADLVIFEDNGRTTKTYPHMIDAYWYNFFNNVRYIGRSHDYDWSRTTIYHLSKVKND